MSVSSVRESNSNCTTRDSIRLVSHQDLVRVGEESCSVLWSQIWLGSVLYDRRPRHKYRACAGIEEQIKSTETEQPNRISRRDYRRLQSGYS